MSRFSPLLASLLFLATAVAHADGPTRWVVSDRTTLKESGSITSPDITPLPVGTELTLLEEGGRWLKVRTADGKEGWVFAGRVADTKPVTETSSEGGLFEGVSQQSSIKTAKADSARSIRGLSPEATQYAQNRGTPQLYRTELDRILARSVTPKKLDTFLRNGKLGEYAE